MKKENNPLLFSGFGANSANNANTKDDTAAPVNPNILNPNEPINLSVIDINQAIFRKEDIIYDNESNKKYVRLLRANEKVICAGTILKHEKVMNNMNAAIAPKQRRILLITDSPRMIFIDTIGSIVRGHLELQAEMKTEIKIVSRFHHCIASVLKWSHLIVC
jgi:hypothetical protein